MTSFKALYSHDTPTLVPYEFSHQDKQSLQVMLIDKDRLLVQLKWNMAKSQQFMKLYVYKNRRQLKFHEGDLMSIKL